MKRLLFIAHRVPYPPDKGERVRAFREIVALSKSFRITLASLSHTSDAAARADGLRPWCEEVVVCPAGGLSGLVRGTLCLLRGRSVTEGFFHSRRLDAYLREASQREPFDLVFAYSSGTLPAALGVPAGARVADLVDADSAKWQTYADRAAWPKSWLYRRESLGVRRLERLAVRRCDAVVLVSEAEADALGQVGGNVFAVANGVDADYFAPPPDHVAGRRALAFVGTMDYRPNVEGVCWFVGEVWPRLRRRLGDLTLTIVGRDPARAVRRLSGTPGVTVTGTVDDVRPYVAAAGAVIAPLRIARGVQNKVLEAMAMAKPVVASPAALEGLDVRVGEEALQADSPEQWERAILHVLEDAALAERLGEAARRCVLTRYDWAARMESLVELCKRVCEREPARAAVAGSAGEGASR